MLQIIIIIIIITTTSYHRYPSPGTSPLEPMAHHSALKFDCSTFLRMCDVPGTVIFFVENLLNAFVVLFPDLF
jgi:hypothetical protein